MDAALQELPRILVDDAMLPHTGRSLVWQKSWGPALSQASPLLVVRTRGHMVGTLVEYRGRNEGRRGEVYAGLRALARVEVVRERRRGCSWATFRRLLGSQPAPPELVERVCRDLRRYLSCLWPPSRRQAGYALLRLNDLDRFADEAADLTCPPDGFRQRVLEALEWPERLALVSQMLGAAQEEALERRKQETRWRAKWARQAPVRKWHRLEELLIWRRYLRGAEQPILIEASTPNPVVVQDLVIVALFSPGMVCAFDRATGLSRWRRRLAGLGGSPPSQVQGLVLVTDQRTLYALDADTGRPRWRFCPCGNQGEWVYTQPIVARGRVLIGDRKGRLHCLDVSAGSLVWSVQTAERTQLNSTGLVWGDTVVVTNLARDVIAYDLADGRERWRVRLDDCTANPIQRLGDMVLVWTSGFESPGTLYFLDPERGEIVQRMAPGGQISDLCLAGDRILVRLREGDRTSRLVAINDFRVSYVIEERDYSCHGMGWEATTGIVYEQACHGLVMLSPGDGSRELGILLERPDAACAHDGCLYVLDNDGYLSALHHP